MQESLLTSFKNTLDMFLSAAQSPKPASQSITSALVHCITGLCTNLPVLPENVATDSITACNENNYHVWTKCGWVSLFLTVSIATRPQNSSAINTIIHTVGLRCLVCPRSFCHSPSFALLNWAKVDLSDSLKSAHLPSINALWFFSIMLL